MVAQTLPGKVVVFHDPTYPHLYSHTLLEQLIPFAFQTASAMDLSARLDEDCMLLISFQSPYFPKDAWGSVLRFLGRGGSLALFGGMPFTRPVRADGTLEPEQDAYCRQIYLGPFFQLEIAAADPCLTLGRVATFLKECDLHLATPGQLGTYWSCYPKLSQVDEHPGTLGSTGSLDSMLTPLIFLRDSSSPLVDYLATPAFMLDQHGGRFQGGRWLISAWQPVSEQDWLVNANALQRLLTITYSGMQSVEVHPTLACYRRGEIPTLTLEANIRQHCTISITVKDANDQPLHCLACTFLPIVGHHIQQITLPEIDTVGLYCIETLYHMNDELAMQQESGFWLWNSQLVEQTHNKRLTAGLDYFYQAKTIFLICGTTYMDSVVQRKFLLLPNPARWDRDFAEMKAAGINFLRTGLWDGWSDLMPTPGIFNEVMLRTLDAFVMTACAYDMQIIFTFFAFYPPLFGGENPWHDPRSTQAQENFVATLARRYTQVELLSWDLINEPSLGDPASAFAARPLAHHNRFEIAAFQRWLTQHYTLTELQLRWRQTPAELPTWEQILPPIEKDYHTEVSATEPHNMLKVADYTHFTQHAFNTWATQMHTTIREAGSQTLVGVGQDESGARISPQFYSSSVDYTTTHPWWNNDHLLWDMLLDKTPYTPNLIQETGVMLARSLTGHPWRSEAENASLLERKLITGLAARGAGLVQWLWHTNGYMTSDNENSIGLVRVDGSAKPELAVMREFGSLMRALKPQRIESPPLDVWLVIPYSQWFTHPNLGVESTQHAVRVLGYDMGIIPQLISEYRLDELLSATHRPRTVIVPALQIFSYHAWQQLLQFVAEGGRLLVSGILGRDTHDLSFDLGVAALQGTHDHLRPVSLYEQLEERQITGGLYLAYGGQKIGYVRKAHNQLRVCQHGAGIIFWSGLPLELASSSCVTQQIYRHVLGLDSKPPLNVSARLVVRQQLATGTLVLIVSEIDQVQCVSLENGLEIEVAPNRAGAVILYENGQIDAFGGIRPLKHEM